MTSRRPCQSSRFIRARSKEAYLEIIERLRREGVDRVILGCMELTLLLGPSDTILPISNTTGIHARAGMEFIIGSASING